MKSINIILSILLLGTISLYGKQEEPDKKLILDLNLITSYQIEQNTKDTEIICAFNTTTYNMDNEDSTFIDNVNIGNQIKKSKFKFWLDIKNKKVINFLVSKIDYAKELGCESILFYDTNIYEYKNGFSIGKYEVEFLLDKLVKYSKYNNMEVYISKEEVRDNIIFQNLSLDEKSYLNLNYGEMDYYDYFIF